MARRSLLIVDDIATNRTILGKILAEEYDIVEAANGVEALGALRREGESICAVVLDILMPVMDGFGVLRAMQADESLASIPVIVATGNSDSGSELKALSLGAIDFITKPYNPALIKQRIANTVRLRETAAMANAARRDKLTGLYAREAFFERAGELIAARPAGSYVIACFDIDSFKVINDQYGSARGDEVLKHIANTFKERFAPYGGICCRIASDNFAVLYPKSLLGTEELARIRAEAAAPAGLIRPITFSIGRYIVDDLSLPISGMYDRAALAEESVKGLFDGNIGVYDESMRTHLLREQKITSEMRGALNGGQFEVWFQPQFNHSTGALIGAEALARWRHPSNGQLISPSVFVPVFERNGFIYELDKYVWEQVCILLRRWMDEGRSPLPVALNVSRYDVFRDDLIDTIVSLVERYGVPVDLLRLEITESAFAESAEQIITVVKQLIERGFTIEIDDFGSGYSSLNTLKDVPAQVVKLDMRFLENSDNSDRGGNILESIVRMSKWLGMAVIAEGVETIEQADFLTSIGCSYIQGYLYAKPMQAVEYEALARKAGKEERLLSLVTVDNLNNNSFWDPNSMDTLIFNSYVGGACIFEWHNEHIEIVRANDKYAKVIGGENNTIDDALSLVWEEHMDEAAALATKNAIERTIATGDEATYEAAYTDLPGAPGTTYLRTTFRAIARTSDRYLLYSINENITEQRENERRLREYAERFEALNDALPGGIATFEITPDDVRLIYFNEGFYSCTGYTREEYAALVERDALALVFEGDRADVMCAVKSMLEGGIPFIECTYRCHTVSGGFRWFNMQSAVSERFEGRVVANAVQLDVTSLKAAEDSLRISEEEFRMAAVLGERSLARYDIKTGVYHNDSSALFSQDYGETIRNMPEEFVNSGVVAPECVEEYLAFFDSIKRGEETCSMNAAMRVRESGYRWFHCEANVIRDANSRPARAILVFTDITEYREKEAAFLRWQQSLEEKDPASYTVYNCNLSKDATFDTVEGALITMPFSPEATTFNARAHEYAERFVHPDDRAAYLELLDSDSLKERYRRGARSASLEYRELCEGEDYRWLLLTVELVEYPDSADIASYLMYENIDESKRAELLAKKLAESDPLTGILNRTAFIEAFNSLIGRTSPGAHHAVFMMDIDGFKRLNDSFGHAAGDRALVSLATAVRSVLRQDDLFGRLGGDEFIVCLKEISEDDVAAGKAEQICSLVRRSLSADVSISVSIGVAVYPRDGRDFDALYRNADAALYLVKENGKDSFAFYDDMSSDLRRPAHAAPSGAGAALVTYDWKNNTFEYSSGVAGLIAGRFNDRNLWLILLSDMVASVVDVKLMQELTHDVATDRSRMEGSVSVTLKTPSGARHPFRMSVAKQVNDLFITDKLLLTFTDLSSQTR